jgi:hypothetical protein
MPRALPGSLQRPVRVGAARLLQRAVVQGDLLAARRSGSGHDHELFRWWAVHAGLCHDGKGAVYHFALGAHHRRANLLPRAAPGQVCNALLEAAVKDKPAVLVPGVDSTLGGLGMEAEGSGEGSEGGKCPHGRRRAP